MTRAEAEQQKHHILILTLGIVLALALGVLLLYPFEGGQRIYPLSLLVLIGLFSFYIIEKNGQVKEAMLRLEVERFQALLDSLLRIALELTDANRGTIMLIDLHSGTLGVVSAFNVEPQAIAASWMMMGSGIAGYVAQRKEPVFLSGSVRDDSRFHDVTLKKDAPKEAICVPLMSGQDVVGTLSVSLVGHVDRSFSQERFAVVKMFAEHIALDKEAIADLVRFKKKGLMR